MKKIFFLNVFFICLLKSSFSQPGRLDSTFGSHGIVTTNLGVNYDYNYVSNGKQVVLLSDGTMLILIEASGNCYLTKRLSDGTVDLSYGNNGFSGPVEMLPSYSALQMDGKIVVAGEAFNGLDYDFAVARYNTDGSLDNSFSEDGKQITDFASDFDNAKSVAIQSDGKIVVTGETVAGGVFDFGVTRYNPDGSLDSTFSEDGKQTTSFADYDNATSLAIQADGKIVVAGYILNGTNRDFALVRYNIDGSADSTFDGDGKLTTDFNSSEDFINSLAIQSDGKIVVAGYVYTCDAVSCNNAEFALARYNADGTIDKSFNGNGMQKTAFNGFAVANSIVIENDGKMIAAGFFSPEGNTDFAMARYNADGSLDNTFDSDGKQTTDVTVADNAYSVAVQSDGKIVVAGSGESGVDFLVVRYNSSGGLDDTFDEDGVLIDQLNFNQGSTYYTCTAVQSNGKIVVAGYAWNGVNYDFALARYNANGTLDSSFSEDGKQNTGFSENSDDNATCLSIQKDGKIVLCGKTYNSETGNGDFAIARYKSDGNLDSSFSVNGEQTTDFGGNDYANSITIQSDGKLVAAGNNDLQFAMARYNVDGSLDKNFSDDGKQTNNFFPLDSYSVENASSVAVQSDGKIVMTGDIISANPGQDVSYFAFIRYNTNGSVDTFSTIDFGSGYDISKSVAIQNDGKIVLVGYSYKRIDEHTVFNPVFAIARLNTDGSLDSTFDGDGKQTTDFDGDAFATSIAVQNDMKILVAGFVIKASIPNTDFAIARYKKNGALDSTFNGDGKQTTDAGGTEGISGIAISNNKIYAVGSGQYPGNLGVLASYIRDEEQTISCTLSKIVSTDKGRCDAVVNNVDPVLQSNNDQVNYSLVGATVANGTGSVSGKVFNKGITTVSYSMANDTSRRCSFSITVNDDQAPDISPIFAFPNIIWPANNKMWNVYLLYYGRDNCGSTDCKISVTGNQDIAGDWQIVNDHLIKLRAKHSGGKKRIYTITVTCKDAAGNNVSRSVDVTVPKLKRRKFYISYEADAARPFENIAESFGLKAFPNPSNNHFNIQVLSRNTEPINLKLYDISGRLLETKLNLKAGENILVGGSLKKGIYLIEVQQGKDVQHLKLVKAGN